MFGLVNCTFIELKIVPAFMKIFKNFGVDLPGPTLLMISSFESLSQFGWLLLPIAAIVCFLLVRAAMRYINGSFDSLSGLVRVNTAIILHWLAVAVRQDRPITEMLRLLAGYYPRRSIRRRLEGTAKRVERGEDWYDCLRQTRIIRRAEVAVFRSAERTGNLVWRSRKWRPAAYDAQPIGSEPR